MSTAVVFNLPICRACGGRGWVDSMYKGAQVCPICLGTGVEPQRSEIIQG